LGEIVYAESNGHMTSRNHDVIVVTYAARILRSMPACWA